MWCNQCGSIYIFLFPLFSFVFGTYVSTKTSDNRPVFFTNFIQNNKSADAQTHSKIFIPDVPDVKSYAGYFTVNKEFNSNLFVWYFTAEVDWENAPVILWLQGGPAMSMLYGIFNEHGPLTITKRKREFQLGKRETSWNRNHNMIYVDSPVGVGFSFRDDERGDIATAKDAAVDLLAALVQFFQIFPEIRENDFFIAGESYGGKFAVSLATAVHEHNKNAQTKIRLKGLAIGNGFIDPESLLEYSSYLYWKGFLDTRGRKELRSREQSTIEMIQQRNFPGAFKKFTDVMAYIRWRTGFWNLNNYLHTVDQVRIDDWNAWVLSNEASRLLGVNTDSFSETKWDVYHKFRGDFMVSVSPLVAKLVKYYRILIYNGQLDVIVPFQLSEKWIANLDWNGAKKFKRASRKLWFVKSDFAGHSKSFGNLTHVLVRNAGHMVPAEQPEWALDLITRFTRNQPIGKESLQYFE